MENELYESLVKHIADHGYKLNNSGSYKDSAVNDLHAVISHLYNPERYFVYLLNKSFLIRKYDDKSDKTSNNRRPLSSI